MEIKLNLKGTVRKDLVKLISETLGVEAQYQFMPTCNYVIGDYTLTPEGTLIFAEHVDAEQLLVVLKREGFIAEEQKTHDTTIQNEPYSFVVNIPTNFVNMPNLKKLFEVKGELIKKALKADELSVKEVDGCVVFKWDSNINSCAEVQTAYTFLVSALCRMSRSQKRINSNSTEHQIKNEKYAFRCFLLRLGFIGEQFKLSRKILLKNLDGNSAFRILKQEGVAHGIA